MANVVCSHLNATRQRVSTKPLRVTADITTRTLDGIVILQNIMDLTLCCSGLFMVKQRYVGSDDHTGLHIETFESIQYF